MPSKSNTAVAEAPKRAAETGPAAFIEKWSGFQAQALTSGRAMLLVVEISLRDIWAIFRGRGVQGYDKTGLIPSKTAAALRSAGGRKFVENRQALEVELARLDREAAVRPLAGTRAEFEAAKSRKADAEVLLNDRGAKIRAQIAALQIELVDLQDSFVEAATRIERMTDARATLSSLLPEVFAGELRDRFAEVRMRYAQPLSELAHRADELATLVSWEPSTHRLQMVDWLVGNGHADAVVGLDGPRPHGGRSLRVNSDKWLEIKGDLQRELVEQNQALAELRTRMADEEAEIQATAERLSDLMTEADGTAWLLRGAAEMGIEID